MLLRSGKICGSKQREESIYKNGIFDECLSYLQANTHKSDEIIEKFFRWGHLHILQYVTSDTYPSAKTYRSIIYDNKWCYAWACAYNHLDIVEFAYPLINPHNLQFGVDYAAAFFKPKIISYFLHNQNSNINWNSVFESWYNSTIICLYDKQRTSWITNNSDYIKVLYLLIDSGVVNSRFDHINKLIFVVIVGHLLNYGLTSTQLASHMKPSQHNIIIPFYTKRRERDQFLIYYILDYIVAHDVIKYVILPYVRYKCFMYSEPHSKIAT